MARRYRSITRQRHRPNKCSGRELSPESTDRVAGCRGRWLTVSAATHFVQSDDLVQPCPPRLLSPMRSQMAIEEGRVCRGCDRLAHGSRTDSGLFSARSSTSGGARSPTAAEGCCAMQSVPSRLRECLWPPTREIVRWELWEIALVIRCRSSSWCCHRAQRDPRSPCSVSLPPRESPCWRPDR